MVILAESMDVFDAAAQAKMSTELLPGEDPALLGGPDRISFYRLVHAGLPIAGREPGMTTITTPAAEQPSRPSPRPRPPRGACPVSHITRPSGLAMRRRRSPGGGGVLW